MPDATLKRIKERAAEEFLPLLGEEQCAYVEWLVREARPQLAVEVGALVGYATIRIARQMPPQGRVVAIEIAQDLARRAEENIAAAGLASRVRVIRGDAREVLADVPGPVDFVLLDAERSQYLHHLKRLEARLMPGATIVAAGTGKGARLLASYLDYVRTDPRYESERRVFGDDAVEVSRFRG